MAAVAICFALLALAHIVLPQAFETHYNRISHPPPYKVSPVVSALHQKLVIVDLHADSLLWGRDLLRRSEQGHVDVPRLMEGNVAIQVFTVVTKSPENQNISRNDDKSDTVIDLAKANGWPPRTYNSLKERALYQAERLQQMAAASKGKLTLIRTQKELDVYLEQRKNGQKGVAGVLGLEGAHALEGDLNNLDLLYDAGFRMVAPTHFFDTDIASSSSGIRKAGLTAKGREFVRRMQAKHMLIDLAHASPQTIDDVTAMATVPVVVSHTGVRGTCDNQRNLADSQIRAVAKTGGVVGIGYWQVAVCGSDANAIARAIRYAANVGGVEHVALGSDFDGAVTTPFDATGIAQITEALLKQGFSQSDIAAIMGGNAIRVLRQTLP